MAYDYSQYGGVLVARQNKVLTITLNAPDTLNAFTGPMHSSTSRIWDEIAPADLHVAGPVNWRWRSFRSAMPPLHR